MRLSKIYINQLNLKNYMSKELADFTIEYLKKKGVDYAEARLESINSSGFMLNNSNPEISGFTQTQGIGVRYLIKKSLGFIALNNLEKNKIKQELENSLKLTLKASKISEKISLAEHKPIKKSVIIKPKKELGEEQKLNYLKELDKNVNADHKQFSLSDEILEKYFINTEGTQITQKIPRVNFFYFITLLSGSNSIQRYLQFGATTGYEALKKWDLHTHLNSEIKALRENLEYGISPPKGELDIVLGPEVTGIAVHESAGHPTEADRIMGRESAQAGESFITEKMLNTKIGSELVTVADDPTIEKSYGFYLYDDEGVKARERLLYKDGIINEFLHNRETAAKMNIQSNGAARANSYSVEPIVRMSNTYLKPKDYTEDELIKDIRKGIYIKNFMEWNIDDRRYQQRYVGDEAYLIENGEITKPVKSPIIEITTPKFWSSVDAVANNLQFFAATCGKGEPMQGIPVFTGGPSIRLRKIRFN